MSPVERIENLIKFLPPKDIILGEKFIKERRFSDLKDLVNSVLYKKKKSSKIDKSYIEDYDGEDIIIDEEYDSLKSLKIEIDNYCLLLGIDDEDSEIENYLRNEY